MAPTAVPREVEQPNVATTKQQQLKKLNNTTTTTSHNNEDKIEGVIDFSRLRLAANERLQNEESKKAPYTYEGLQPHFPKVKWAPLEKFEFKDVAKNVGSEQTDLSGVFSNKDYPNLFSKATKVIHLTHKTGTELQGVKLSELSDIEKKELALLIARRVVVFFRDQDDLDVQKQIELGKFYGRLHRHATTGLPKAWTPEIGEENNGKESELDQIHVIWADSKRLPRSYAAFPSTYLWHSDVSYEVQPPSYTSLKLLTAPTTGGDTLWISGYDLYDQLSPGLKAYVDTHSALHSAVEQANDAERNGNFVRRAPIITEHPLVRVHPVTGWKALYINPGFTRSIVGVPKGESDAILKYLFELIATSQAGTVRFKWNENDVAFWDNRVAVHSATYGFYPERRHGIRVTSHGEVPYYDPKGRSQQEDIDKLLEVERDNDGSKGGNYND